MASFPAGTRRRLVSQHPSSCSCSAQRVLPGEAVPSSWVQDLALPSAELHEVALGPSLQWVGDALRGHRPIWCIGCSSVVCHLHKRCVTHTEGVTCMNYVPSPLTAPPSRYLMKTLRGTGRTAAAGLCPPESRGSSWTLCR